MAMIRNSRQGRTGRASYTSPIFKAQTKILEIQNSIAKKKGYFK